LDTPLKFFVCSVLCCQGAVWLCCETKRKRNIKSLDFVDKGKDKNRTTLNRPILLSSSNIKVSCYYIEFRYGHKDCYEKSWVRFRWSEFFKSLHIFCCIERLQSDDGKFK
jgi:hypothetical protein